MRFYRCHVVASSFLPLAFLAGCTTSPIKGTEIPESNETEPRRSYLLGVKALQEKNFDLAASNLTKCLLIDPNKPECHWELGWAHFMNNNYELAEAQWKIVAQLQPKREALPKALQKATAHIALMASAHQSRNKEELFEKRHRRTSPTPLRTPPTSSPPQKSLIIHAVGDTMLGTEAPDREMPPDGFSPLSEIQDHLAGADITFANYEGTLCDAGVSDKCKDSKGPCYAFRSPTRFASYLKEAGFDTISLANNHIMDYDESCRVQTEQTLDQAKIIWSGRTGSIARFEKNHQKISFIAFHAAPHCNYLNDLETAKALVRAEKKLHRLIIVSFHGGAEGFEATHVPGQTEIFLGEDRGFVKNFAHRMIDAGADLILGSGPHVLRAMEIYKRRLVAYSLGNFATYKMFNISGISGIGMILEAELDSAGRFVRGKVIPTRQISYGVPTIDTRGTAIDLVRLLSHEDFPLTGVRLDLKGQIYRK